MHTARNHRHRRAGARRWALAVLTGAALVALGLQSPALAAPAGDQPKPPPTTHARQVKTGKPSTKPVCGAPKKNQVTCLSMRRTDISGVKGVLVGEDDTPFGYGPDDLRGAYKLPADGGAGQTVAIVDAYDDPNAESDLAVYRQQYGLPPCTTANGCFRKVDQRGGTSYPVADPLWSGEISLDLDMVSAVAPQAHILLVEGDVPSADDLGTAVDTAVALGAKYVSNSYGGFEDPSETQLDHYFQHPGVAVVASSGDAQYGVQYPAASPYVTSVGGTSLVRDSSTRGWSESVWSNAIGGTGSGCSRYEPKPAFQQDSGCAKRTVADVSAVADPYTGVAVYDSFQNPGWGLFGGTSVSSPIIASVFADAGTPAAGSYPNSYPYGAASALNDVTQGNNGGCTPTYLCTAGAGYDGPTGLGTPAGLDAFHLGAHGRLHGTVTDAHTKKPLSGVTVTAGKSTATTGADGTYSFTLLTGDYDLSAAKYGYHDQTLGSVAIADGSDVTKDVALAALPTARVSGKVADGSGHGYPLYAQIAIDGVPGAPVYTDPHTGAYQIDLPTGSTYHLHVTANYPGYQPTVSDVAVGADDVSDDISVPVNSKTCNAPGYRTDGTGACAPVAGGLVMGTVTDDNTDAGVPGAMVASADAPGTNANSMGATGDPAVGAGFYWLFSGLTGEHKFTAGKTKYTSGTDTVNVVADGITTADFTLKAGQITITSGDVHKSVTLGKKDTATVTVKNTGGEPATVHLGEAGDVPPADAWTRIADFPTPISDNLVATNDGIVYSVFGWRGFGAGGATADMYAYDPAKGSWTKLASAPAPHDGASGAFINGKLYVTGGWGPSGRPDGELDIYDPVTNSWSTGAPSPVPLARAGHTVLDGKLYMVAGCDGACKDNVEVYDPQSNTWSAAAAYPEIDGGLACGGISGQIYCSGGNSGRYVPRAYVYDPVGNAWAQIPSPPTAQAYGGYTVANGKLLISGGTDGVALSMTAGYAYDPTTAAWTRLPGALDSLTYSGGALGFYRVGGEPGPGLDPVSSAEVLTGYDQSSGDVPWLSEGTTQLTLQPGQSTKVTVTLDAGDLSAGQTYDASITVLADTPYTVPAVPVSLRVTPPKSWGQITGTVQGDDGKGGSAPLAGATVQIKSSTATYTLKTDKDGKFALWLDANDNPLQLTVSKDGYQQQEKTISLVKGKTVTSDFILKTA